MIKDIVNGIENELREIKGVQQVKRYKGEFESNEWTPELPCIMRAVQKLGVESRSTSGDALLRSAKVKLYAAEKNIDESDTLDLCEKIDEVLKSMEVLDWNGSVYYVDIEYGEWNVFGYFKGVEIWETEIQIVYELIKE